MASARRARNRWLTAACVGGGALLLGGCFAYDAAKPFVAYLNSTDQTVVVTIEGLQTPVSREVPPGTRIADVPIDECVGTSIAVETEDGEFIGRIDKPACPDWFLSVNEDYTLTYRDLGS